LKKLQRLQKKKHLKVKTPPQSLHQQKSLVEVTTLQKI
jgi:hypothetical protein